jgi:uncharacterized protein YuzE
VIWQAGYSYLLPEPHPKIVRTVSIGEDVMFDLDIEGRLVGVEWLGDADWVAALARAAMTGRLRISWKAETGEEKQ